MFTAGTVVKFLSLDTIREGTSTVVDYSWQLAPDAEEVKEMRDREGIGLHDAKRLIVRRNIVNALEWVNATTPAEIALRAILQAIFEQGLL